MKSAIIGVVLASCGVPASSVRAAPPAPFAEASAISGADLGAITGRADTAMLIRAENSATVANNNVIGDSTTGSISFDPQSFQNLNGLSLLSANTGNNVSINSSLNLNVAIHP